MTKDDKECIKYILYQTKHGVSLEDVLRNLGSRGAGQHDSMIVVFS